MEEKQELRDQMQIKPLVVKIMLLSNWERRAFYNTGVIHFKMKKNNEVLEYHIRKYLHELGI